MKHVGFLLAGTVALMLVASGCSTYYSAQKADDGAVYLTGSTWMFLTTEWVKKCSESGNTLTCETMDVN